MDNFDEYFLRERKIFLENISYETVQSSKSEASRRLGCRDTVVAQLIMPAGVKFIFNRRLSFEPEALFTLSVSFGVGKYYIVSGMMITVFSQTDKIMIKMMIGNAENGYYSTAATCAALSSFVFAAVIDSMRPLIFSAGRESRELFNLNMSRLYSVIIYMGLAQSVVLTLFAKPIIMILYGAEYSAAIPILRIITWYSAFSYMGSVRNIWILAEDKQRYLWIINLSGAVLNVMGNAVLIPICGAAGAAVASVATQFFTNFILCLIMKPIKPTAKLIFRALNPKLLFDLIPKRGNENEK